MNKRFYLSTILALSTCLAYSGVYRLGFISFDDPVYLTRNPHVLSGLTINGIIWSFTTFHAANWHPLTWLSHMTDVTLFGVTAALHHLASLLLHVVSTVVLFLILDRATGRRRRSFVIAAIFSLHPLHVESVAWLAERKDVLSVMFWMVALYAYLRHAERPGVARYALVVILFTCGLMAKPMLVTFPVILLLLDYWPLGRFREIGSNPASAPFGPAACSVSIRVILEKLPLLALSGVSAAVTFWAQQTGGTVSTLVEVPLKLRLGNGLDAYWRYIGLFVRPTALAILYPFPVTIPLWRSVAAAVAICAVSCGVFWLRRSRPYLFVGWFWYLVTLLPVIGLVQVGAQAMADRYMYLPMIGLIMAMVWSVAEAAAGNNVMTKALPLVTAAIMLVCGLLTARQIAFWRDDITLYRHALEVTDGNYTAHLNLGCALGEAGRQAEAVEQFRLALRISPANAEAYLNLGNSLLMSGRTDEAIEAITSSIRLHPDWAAAYNELGAVMLRKGDLPMALQNFNRAVTLDPQLANALFNKAVTLSALGKNTESVAWYRQALAVSPDDAECHARLATELILLGQPDEAMRHLAEAVRLNPADTLSRKKLDLLVKR